MSTATAALVNRERLADRLLRNWKALHPDDVMTPFQQPAAPPQRRSPPPNLFRATRLVHHSTSFSSSSPVDSGPVDDSLTSLSWLQNLNVMKLANGSGNGSAAGRNNTASGSTAHRPTGAVQPIPQQQQQPQQQAAKSHQHIHVDPNAILDMTGCGGITIRIKPEPTTDSAFMSNSPPSRGSSTNGGSPPRLSPPPPPRCANGHLSEGGSPSPPPLSLQVTGTTGGGGGETAQQSLAKPPHSYATLICMAMNDAVDQRVTLSGIYGWIIDNFPYYRTADPSWQVFPGILCNMRRLRILNGD